MRPRSGKYTSTQSNLKGNLHDIELIHYSDKEFSPGW